MENNNENMSTPTPETDAKEKELRGYFDLNAHDRFELMSDFAKSLETRLAAAEKERDTLKARVEELEREAHDLSEKLLTAQRKLAAYEAPVDDKHAQAALYLIEYYNSDELIPDHKKHREAKSILEKRVDAVQLSVNDLIDIAGSILARAYRQQAKENAEALREAQHLTHCIFKNHYEANNPVKFEVAGSTSGCLMQISNMIAGLGAQIVDLKRQLAQFEGAIEMTHWPVYVQPDGVRRYVFETNFGDRVLILRAKPNNLPAAPNGDALPSKADVGAVGSNSTPGAEEGWGDRITLALDLLGSLAKLVTRGDGVDPEAFWIELTPEEANLIREVAKLVEGLSAEDRVLILRAKPGAEGGAKS